MASGVGINPDCMVTFEKLKLGKKFKYIIFTLNKANTEIIVEKTSESGEYDDFLAELPETECRWAVYDFHFLNKEGGKRDKIVFYSWSPDSAKIKPKMMFASSKEVIRKSLVGVSIEIQGTDYAEVSHEVVLEKARRGN